MSANNPYSGEPAPHDDGTPLAAPCKSARTTLAVIRICGEEATDFLHGQFSADLRALQAGHTLVTAWCSPKGGVLFMPRLLRDADGSFHALLPAAQGAAFVKRLRLFVLRAKVVIEDCTANHGVLVLDGTDAPPAMPGLVAATDGERRWLVGPRAALATLWDALALPAQGDSAARLADIARGEFMLDTTLSDAFLPQELNLDLLQGVSFNKGCYPGQEIVARVKFRGAVKRRLQRLRIATDAAPAAGARLLDGHAVRRGTVLVSATQGSACCEALAVIDIDAGSLHLVDQPGALIAPLSLPYALPGA